MAGSESPGGRIVISGERDNRYTEKSTSDWGGAAVSRWAGHLEK